jgi:uncharacterized protein (TIGR02246 family)
MPDHSSDDAGAEQAIRDIIARLTRAEATLDAPAFDDLVADDVVILPPNVPLVEGREACLAFIHETLGEVAALFSREMQVDVSEVRVSGDLAFDRGTYEDRLTPKAGGDVEIETGKYLRVYGRGADGRWKVARISWSQTFPPELLEEPAAHD